MWMRRFEPNRYHFSKPFNATMLGRTSTPRWASIQLETIRKRDDLEYIADIPTALTSHAVPLSFSVPPSVLARRSSSAFRDRAFKLNNSRITEKKILFNFIVWLMKMSFHLLEFICAVCDLAQKSSEQRIQMTQNKRKKVFFFSKT